MSSNERQMNNVRAGIFVTAALALAVTSIVLLSDLTSKLFQPTNEYQVMFKVSEGVKNLKEGADVRIGGVSLGRVIAVTPRLDQAAPFEIIDVTLSVDQRVTLYQDAYVVVTPATIGADAWIDITTVGSQMAMGPNDVLEGRSGPGLLAALLGPNDAAKASEIVDNVVGATERAEALVARVQDDWPGWSDKVVGILDYVYEASDRVNNLMVKGHEFVDSLNDTVDTNRPRFDNVMVRAEQASENVAEVTRQFREQSMAKVERFLDRGNEGIDNVIAVIDRVGQDYDTWAPDVRDTLANFRLTAQQIKLAGIEIRRSPWKLLYRPSRTELDHEFLYEATRSFAMATSDLKAAVDSTERLLNHHGGEIAEDERLQQLFVQLLDRPIDDYEKARERLLDVLAME